MGLIHGMLDGALTGLWLLLDLVVLAVAIGVASDIRASLRRRRARKDAERATWDESVTKHTKPPPMVAVQPKSPERIREEALRIVKHIGHVKSDPSLPARLAFAKSPPEGRDKARQSIAAERVRRVTKRRK